MENKNLITKKEKIKAGDKLMICFPYAGSGASLFKNWQEIFGERIRILPVQLPGREERFSDEPYKTKDVLFDDMYEEIKSLDMSKIYLFGHSMGARIAYEMSRRLERDGVDVILVVSGCSAPHIPDADPISHLPKAGFREALRKYNCTPPEILDSEEMFDVFYPLLLSDFVISETCIFEKAKHTFPIIVLGATDDGDAPVDGIMQWAQYSEDCRIHIFDGDHFFVRDKESEVLEYIAANI